MCNFQTCREDTSEYRNLETFWLNTVDKTAVLSLLPHENTLKIILPQGVPQDKRPVYKNHVHFHMLATTSELGILKKTLFTMHQKIQDT